MCGSRTGLLYVHFIKVRKAPISKRPLEIAGQCVESLFLHIVVFPAIFMFPLDTMSLALLRFISQVKNAWPLRDWGHLLCSFHLEARGLMG